MKTAVIGIGNSDDKLTQKEWTNFCKDVCKRVLLYLSEVHFIGYTAPNSIRQSFSLVGATDWPEPLERILAGLARDYRQDSIALTVGDTVLVEPCK